MSLPIVTEENAPEILMRLHNASRRVGLAQFFPTVADDDLTLERARAILEREVFSDGVKLYFDYLNGRVLKIHLEIGESINPRLYDRDLGEGAAMRALEGVRMNLPPAGPTHIRRLDGPTHCGSEDGSIVDPRCWDDAVRRLS